MNDRGKRTVLAAARLREMVVSGELKPGQRIGERVLGEQLGGVSRTPLREAFKILEAEGLVTISPNKGAVVTALSFSEVEAAIEVLIGLESMAAEPACAHITAEELAAIDELQQRMTRARQDGDLMEYFCINQTIHQRIVDAARNPVLSRIYNAESARIRRYRYAGNRRHERWDRALAEHAIILDTLKQRNGPLLRELLRAHHTNGWNVARVLLEAELGKPPGVERTAKRARATRRQGVQNHGGLSPAVESVRGSTP